MPHVETVRVFRCGYYLEPNIRGGACGDERGCALCREFDTIPSVRRSMERSGIPPGPEGWPIEEITHARFVQEYDRCPDGCEVAVQLDLEEAIRREELAT